MKLLLYKISKNYKDIPQYYAILPSHETNFLLRMKYQKNIEKIGNIEVPCIKENVVISFDGGIY